MNVQLQFALHRAGLRSRPAAAVPIKPPVRTLRPSPAPNSSVYCDPYITPQRRPSRRLGLAAVAVLALVIALTVAVIR